MLLTKLHDREDATHRTRTDVEAIFASIGAEWGAQPTVGTDITAVESPVVETAAAALRTWVTTERITPSSAGATVAIESPVPTEDAESSVAETHLGRRDQSCRGVDIRDASQKPTVKQKPPPWRQRTVTLPPASPRHLVVAAFIDAFPILIVYGIALGIAAVVVSKSCGPYEGGYRTVCGAHMNARGLAVIAIGLLVALAYSIWNWGYRQGTTGATIGNSVVAFKVLSEETGQPVGFDAKRIINVVLLTLAVLVPLSGAVTVAAAHIAGPDYYDRISY